MIENAEEQDVIEEAETLRRQFLHVEDGVFDFGFAEAFDGEEFFIFHAVNGDHFGTTAFAFKTVPAGGSADVEDAAATEVLRQGIGGEARLEVRDRNDAGDDGAIQQFQAVVRGVLRKGFRLQADQPLEFRITCCALDSQVLPLSKP